MLLGWRISLTFPHSVWDKSVMFLKSGNENSLSLQAQNDEIMVDVTLQEYMEREIIPLYDGFDPAHRRDHAEAVISESLRLAASYDVDENMVYAIAACHDVGLSEGREFHHLVSAARMRADRNLRKWFTEEQVETMARAVEDHRASAAQPPRSIYGRIVAEADRQLVPETVIRRTLLYGMAHFPEMDKKTQFRRSRAHLLEKYGEGGYLRLWIPDSPNARHLEELRRILHDDSQLEGIFERLYSEYAGKAGMP